MKKIRLVLALILLVLLCGTLFVACDKTPPSDSNQDVTPPPAEPVAPTLAKSDFSIVYDIISDTENGNEDCDYSLTWTSANATKYKVKYGQTEETITSASLSLKDFAADVIHSVTVTAIGEQNLTSAPVEVKFKGTKMSAPINVRAYLTPNTLDSYYFGYKHDDAEAYKISCEEIDWDDDGEYIWTGRFKSAIWFSDAISIDGLTDIWNTLDLEACQSFRVAALPYRERRSYSFGNDTEVMEISLPSDPSEQSVNFFADIQNANPRNLRWDLDALADQADYATVRWDAGSDFKYRVKVRYPDGSATGTETQKGALQSNIWFDYIYGTGDYSVTVEALCNEFNYIGENADEKWVTFAINLTYPATEEIKFHIDREQMQTPQNVRIDGENIVWDYGNEAPLYNVSMTNGDAEFSLSVNDGSKQLAFSEIFDRIEFELWNNAVLDGDWMVRVMASSRPNEFEGAENNVPVIKAYADSDYCQAVELFRTESIAKVTNVQITTVPELNGSEALRISWDGVAEAVGYKLAYVNGDFVTTTTDIGAQTQYAIGFDISGCTEILIIAYCECEITQEDGVATLYIPSVYRLELQNS